MKTIAFDMDGVLADLITPWLAWNNEKFSDDLTYENLRMMKVSQQARAGKLVNDFLYLKDTYEQVHPYQGMLELVREIKESGLARPIIATKASHNGNMVEGKVKWLERHAPFLDKDDFTFIQDKSLIRADILIDDDPRNLETFPDDKVLVMHPYNIEYAKTHKDLFLSGEWKIALGPNGLGDYLRQEGYF